MRLASVSPHSIVDLVAYRVVSISSEASGLDLDFNPWIEKVGFGYGERYYDATMVAE